MLLGHHLRLELLYLVFLVWKYVAAPPSIARDTEYIQDDHYPTEDQKTVYSSSQHRSMPVITDVNYFERSAAKALSTDGGSVPIWNEGPFNGHIASHVYSASPTRHAFSSVHPDPVSVGTPPTRNSNPINFMRVNSNYRPHGDSPVDSGHYLSRDQSGHLGGRIQLHHNQAAGGQHGGKTKSRSSIQINEKSSIIRGVRQRIKLLQNFSSSELKPVLGNPSEHLEFGPKSHPQIAQRPFIQESWKSYPDHVLAIKGAQPASFRSKQEERTSAERDASLREDETVDHNYKPANFIRVKTSHSSKGSHPLVTTKTSDQDHIQDASMTSQFGPFAPYLPSTYFMPRKGLFSVQRIPSAGTGGIPFQSQIKPSRTIYTTPAPQLAWRHPYRPKSEGDKAKSLDSLPVALSTSNFSGHQYLRTHEGLQTISTPPKVGTVQWLVVKPNLASSSARQTVLSSSVDPSSATKQSVYKSIQRNQNQPHYAGSINAHAVGDFSLFSQFQAPGVTELNSDEHVIPSTMPSVTHYAARETGTIHGVLPSKVKPFQVAPVIRSQRFPTSVGYPTSGSDHFSLRDFRAWQPTALPPPAINGTQQPTAPVVEDLYGKQLNAHSHPLYNLNAPANPNISSSKDLGGRSGYIYPPQTVHDQRALEYGEAKDKIAFSEFQPVQGQSETSHGWTASAFVTPQNTDVPSTSRPAEPVFEFDQSTVKINLALNSSQISERVATGAGKMLSQDLSVGPEDGTRYLFNESTPMFSKVISPNEDTADGDQAQVGLLNHYSQFGSIQSHQNSSNNFTSGTAPQYIKPVQTPMFSTISPERVFTSKSAYLSDGSIHAVHESTSHNETLTRQNATEDQGSTSSSDSIPASPKSVTPQNGIRPVRVKIINSHPALKEALNSSQDAVKSADEAHGENDRTKMIQQKLFNSNLNATQTSRPTSSVVVGKRIKVYPKDKRKPETRNTSQPPIYRSPIIRSKSNSKTSAKGPVGPSKDKTPENHGRSNHSIEVGGQTETSPVSIEVDPGYANPTVITSTEMPTQTRGATQHFSPPPRPLNQKFKSIQSLDVAGSASFSVYIPELVEPVLKETHGRDDLPANSSDTEATHPIGDGWRQNAVKPTSTSLNEDIHSVP